MCLFLDRAEVAAHREEQAGFRLHFVPAGEPALVLRKASIMSCGRSKYGKSKSTARLPACPKFNLGGSAAASQVGEVAAEPRLCLPTDFGRIQSWVAPKGASRAFSHTKPMFKVLGLNLARVQC